MDGQRSVLSSKVGASTSFRYRKPVIRQVSPAHGPTSGGVNITLMTYNGTANIGMVCCNQQIKSLQPLAEYCREAFDMLEASIDDPSLSIDDIGEHSDEVPLSIVSDH